MTRKDYNTILLMILAALILYTAGSCLGELAFDSEPPPDEPVSMYQHEVIDLLRKSEPPESQLGESWACLKVEADFPFYQMIADGHSVDYFDNSWFIDSERVGTAQAEDEAFTACGSPEVIMAMMEYQP